jgi:hypothetical protein
MNELNKWLTTRRNEESEKLIIPALRAMVLATMSQIQPTQPNESNDHRLCKTPQPPKRTAINVMNMER